MEQEWLTPQEVADWLRVPLRTLYHWRNVNEGPPVYRVGGRLRYRSDELETWLLSRREGGTGQAADPPGRLDAAAERVREKRLSRPWPWGDD